MEWYICITLDLPVKVWLCYESEEKCTKDWKRLESCLNLGVTFDFKGRICDNPHLLRGEDGEYLFGYRHIVACAKGVVE